MDPAARTAVILSAASFAVFGICLTLPGALLPILVDHFDIRLVEAGTVLAAQPGAYLIAVLIAGRLLDRLGVPFALGASLATMATGIACFGLAPSWPLAGVALFVCGIGLGVMEVGVNTVLIDVGGERRTNLLNFAHLFFGVGSFASPLLATHAVERGYSWRWPYLAAGLLTLAVGGAWLSVQRTTFASAQGTASPDAQRDVDRGLVALLAALLALYVGVETGVGSWLTKYLTTVRAFSIGDAGNVLALYWLGLTVFRLVLTFVAHRIRDEQLIVALTIVATIALIVALAGSPGAATIAFTVTGIGLSGIFPAVIAMGGRTHPRQVAHVTSVLIAGAGTGGIVIPWLMSALADRTNLTTGMAFYAAMCVAMLTLSLALPWRLSRRRE